MCIQFFPFLFSFYDRNVDRQYFTIRNEETRPLYEFIRRTPRRFLWDAERKKIKAKNLVVYTERRPRHGSSLGEYGSGFLRSQTNKNLLEL